MSGGEDAFLKALYGGVTSDDAFPAMLALLARRFDCPSSGLIYVDPTRPEADLALGHGLIGGEAQARYVAEYAALDPAPAAMARLKIGTAAATDRMFDAEYQASSRFLNEFYHPLGLAEAMGGPFVGAGGRFGLVAVHRGPERAAFSDADLSAFEALMPHIAQAVELRRAFFRLSTTASALTDALEAASGVAITSAAGQLTHANTAARRIMDRRDGLFVTRGGRVTAADPLAARRLQALFAGEAELGDQPLLVRVAREGAEPYGLSVRRLEGEGRSGAGVVQIRIFDPRGDGAREGSTLAAALHEVTGLSRASAALVAALAAGQGRADYAARAGLSLNTVKFHLRSAFAATGLHREADLIRLAVGLAKDLDIVAGG